MGANVYYIGKKYEDAFKSICALVKENCVPGEIVTSANGREIVTPAYRFVYDDAALGFDDECAAGMSEEGASWFAPLRGASKDNGTAVWLNLVENVAASYHSRYSLVEFSRETRIVTPTERERYKLMVSNVLGRFGLPYSEIVQGSLEDSTEDIYGVSLRIELNGGTGQSLPVLCKIYFRKKKEFFVPLYSEEATQIDDYLFSAVEEKSDNVPHNVAQQTASAIIDKVMNALDRLISGEMRDYDFTSCMAFSNPADAETVAQMVAKGPHDDVTLECRSVKVLGISRAKWTNVVFDVTLNGRRILRSTIGINDAFSLVCLNCNSGNLIANNLVKCTETHEGTGDVSEVFYRIDPSLEDLGISDATLETIAEQSELSRHLMPISCEIPSRTNIPCSRRVCPSQTENFETANGEVVRVCKNCPYPEMVFTKEDGTRALTRNLSFARDLMTMTEKADVKTCSCCGRKFSVLEEDGKCKFCHAAVDMFADRTAAKKNYKRFATMLPLGTRLSHLAAKKYCFEEEDVLLFVLGTDKYVFDKLGATRYGYLAAPRKTGR